MGFTMNFKNKAVITGSLLMVAIGVLIVFGLCELGVASSFIVLVLTGLCFYGIGALLSKPSLEPHNKPRRHSDGTPIAIIFFFAFGALFPTDELTVFRWLAVFFGCLFSFFMGLKSPNRKRAATTNGLRTL